jgi:hypothetical protein
VSTLTPVIMSPALDALDTYYQYVKARINAYSKRVVSIAPNKPLNGVVRGMLNAQDWPPKNVVFGAFYLLVLGEEPIGRQGFSPAVPIKFHVVQWTWIIKGDDLQPGERMANRGDRYRISQAMKWELTQGMWPNYAPKQTWNMVNGVFTGTPTNPVSTITWTPVKFDERFDKDSGIVYGTGSTRIQDIQPLISS